MNMIQPARANKISPSKISPSDPPLILLSGDNTHTAYNLYCALVDEGFHVHFASAYNEIEPLWQEKRHPLIPLVVLLEVSGAQGVEAAVSAAISLKRKDPLQFVGYLADPVLRTSGLAGDAIFPRASEQLAKALRTHFRDEP